MVIPWPPKRDFLKTDNDPSTADVLKGTALFSALSDAELASLAKRTLIRSFASAELIFSEGEPCTGFYIVSRGRVRIFKISPTGREQVLALEGPGRSVAELPVFDGGPSWNDVNGGIWGASRHALTLGSFRLWSSRSARGYFPPSAARASYTALD